MGTREAKTYRKSPATWAYRPDSKETKGALRAVMVRHWTEAAERIERATTRSSQPTHGFRMTSRPLPFDQRRRLPRVPDEADE